jgi:hypothetical protein
MSRQTPLAPQSVEGEHAFEQYPPGYVALFEVVAVLQTAPAPVEEHSEACVHAPPYAGDAAMRHART